MGVLLYGALFIACLAVAAAIVVPLLGCVARSLMTSSRPVSSPEREEARSVSTSERATSQ